MIFKITRFVLRQVPDKWRSWLMESALVRPGHGIRVELTLTHEGEHDFAVNDMDWSESKKDKARSMLANFYSDIEVAEAMGVPLRELHEQLKKSVTNVDDLHDQAEKHMLAQQEPWKHNNLNDCNAAGCQGCE